MEIIITNHHLLQMIIENQKVVKSWTFEIKIYKIIMSMENNSIWLLKNLPQSTLVGFYYDVGRTLHARDQYAYPLIRGGISKFVIYSISHCVLLSALTYAPSPTPLPLITTHLSHITHHTQTRLIEIEIELKLKYTDILNIPKSVKMTRQLEL